MTTPAHVEPDRAAFASPSPRTALNYRGLFDSADVADLEVTNVEGAIPEGLVGTLYRNGPGGRRFSGSFFDGDGMIRALSISPDRRARYRARFVETPKYLAERDSDRPLYRCAGTNLPGGAWRNALRAPAHEGNTHVIEHGGRLFAMEEGGRPYVVDPDTLETRGLESFDGALAPHQAFSAHPHRDPDTGDLYNFGLRMMLPRPSLQTFKVDPRGKVTMLGSAKLSGFAFVHDYALTPNWMVFLIAPLRAKMRPIIFGTSSFFEAIEWKPELGTRIVMIPRGGGENVELEAGPIMLGHVLSAWEQDGEVILDATVVDDWAEIGRNALEYRTSDWGGFRTSHTRRYRLDPRSRSVSDEVFCALPADFGRIHPDVETKRPKWGYLAASPREREPGLYHALMKIDRESGATELFDFGRDKVTLEPIFAPRPGGTAEDDGWLLAFVHDSTRAQTDVVVLDARRVSDGPVCTMRLPANAGTTFHGCWVPS